MDSNGQLVVRIESIDVDQKLLESIETPVNASEEQGTQDLTVLREANNDTFFSDELGWNHALLCNMGFLLMLFS